MKNYNKKILFMLLSCIPHISESKIGCMNNSRELTTRYDYKNYEFVQCNCPCGSNANYRILPDRGQCKECKHFHVIKPIKIISNSIQQSNVRPYALTKNIFERYFQKQGSLLLNNL